VGIEMVGDLVGKTEDELLRIEGIGVKAIEELKAGLEERDLLYILDEPAEDDEPDVSQLLEMVFSPDDTELFLGGEPPLSYHADPDYDTLGSSMGLRQNMNDAAELDELLGTVGSLGFSEVDPEQDGNEDETGDDE
jgi:DNA-directed RNA polymerase subunit beta'